MTVLKPYSVNAYNLAKNSENKIHDDSVARRFGFQGGLVPGVDVFAYMTRAGPQQVKHMLAQAIRTAQAALQLIRRQTVIQILQDRSVARPGRQPTSQGAPYVGHTGGQFSFFYLEGLSQIAVLHRPRATGVLETAPSMGERTH